MSELIYQERQTQFAHEYSACCAQAERLSWGRVAAALAGGAALVAGWDGRWLSWSAGVGLAVALWTVFVGLVWRHRRVLAAAARADFLSRLNAVAIARVRRDWDALPLRSAPAECESAPLARDLDLFGRASLFQLASTAATPLGQTTLAQWFVKPAAPEEVAARQQAVRELAGQLDWRQEFEFRGAGQGGRLEDPVEFLTWAESPLWLAGRAALQAYSVAAPLLLIAAVVLQALRTPNVPWWSLVVLVNLAVSALTTRQIHRVYARISAGEQAFGRYARLMEWFVAHKFSAPRLVGLQARLTVDGRDAAAQLDRLERWVTLADLRLSPMVYGPIQAVTLWDVHVLRGIERWQRRAGCHARDWLAALAEVEALASLAALAHAEPAWVDPQFREDPVFAAAALGHPLLPATARVDNEVRLGPPGTLLLVTGSNMSGKSTLLRSVGVNVALAQAGGPVCAASLQMPPLELGTSMRVHDSLAEATSQFMAELKRLKQVVDDATACRGVYLYLLDEILHGTNSRERQIAVRAVLEHLLRRRAIGAVSTHDLELADAPGLSQAAQAVHFRETIVAAGEGRGMKFDYRLRPGVATTTNALALLELVGLPTGGGK